MYDPMGDENHEFVREANKMVSRCALLILLAMALGAVWILEQPLWSLLIFHPRMQELVLQYMGRLYQVSLTMGSFGAATVKPTKLYSNAAWIEDIAGAECLDEAAPTDGPSESAPTYVTYTDAAGETKVKGGPGLKATQAYTRRFAQEVRRAWVKNTPNKFLVRPFSDQSVDQLKSLLHMTDGDQLIKHIYIYIFCGSETNADSGTTV